MIVLAIAESYPSQRKVLSIFVVHGLCLNTMKAVDTQALCWGKYTFFAFFFRKKFPYVVIELDHFRGSRTDTIVTVNWINQFSSSFYDQIFLYLCSERVVQTYELRLRSRVEDSFSQFLSKDSVFCTSLKFLTTAAWVVSFTQLICDPVDNWSMSTSYSLVLSIIQLLHLKTFTKRETTSACGTNARHALDISTNNQSSCRSLYVLYKMQARIMWYERPLIWQTNILTASYKPSYISMKQQCMTFQACICNHGILFPSANIISVFFVCFKNTCEVS